ncbi:MAG: hypothetical protein Q8L74_11480 [Nitrospirota bacterium]|nr:hypothetical protein [Nitrospirota bacterium]MDP2382995.1 hypothetical protein [Nitrospirota bacterium]
MTGTFRILSLALLVIWASACAGPPIPHEPDVIDVTLHATSDQVKTAVTQVLTEGGYIVDRTDDENLTTGYREEINGPWDWLLRWRFGTGRSRVDVLVTSASENSSRLRLHVRYEGKDGIFTRWEESPSATPQSAENQLRLIKNALQIL